MTRAERRHPETAPVDPASCEETAEARRARFKAMARAGGLATAAKLTDDELSAKLRAVRQVRTDKENAERAAAGLPTRTPASPLLDDESMRYWLGVVDELYPDRTVWTNRMQRPRMAIRLARAQAARLAAGAFNRPEGAR